MKTPAQSFGKVSEQQAAQFLKKKGFKILETNFRSRLGEIDLIAKDKNEIVFVEVKSRQNDSCGRPEESITAQKKRKLVQLAQSYLQSHHLEDRAARFDVVSILGSDIQHFKNAFSCED